jgi:hypothetical protein
MKAVPTVDSHRIWGFMAPSLLGGEKTRSKKKKERNDPGFFGGRNEDGRVERS